MLTVNEAEDDSMLVVIFDSKNSIVLFDTKYTPNPVIANITNIQMIFKMESLLAM